MGLSNALIERINRQTAESLPYRGRVIDLGCGDAPYKAHILTKADEYVGVDWESTEHNRGGVDVFADLSRPPLPFDAETADTVVAFQVMEHLAEPREFLIECYRLLRPGGALFITVPFMWEVHEAPHDFYRFTRYGLDYLLEQAGFVDRDIRELTGFWQMWAMKFNYHTARPSGSRLRYLWAPAWLLGQAIAPLLDLRAHHPEETASYVVTARRPA